MTDYDTTDVNLLAAEVTARAQQILGPDAECYACDAATEIIESLGVFSLAGLGLDACATDDIIRRHSTVPVDDEDYNEPFEAGDICTTEDDRLVICTDHGTWTITQDMGLRLIRGLSSLIIRTNEKES